MSTVNTPLEVLAYREGSPTTAYLLARSDTQRPAGTSSGRLFASAAAGSEPLVTAILSFALTAIAVYDSLLFAAGLL